MLRKFKWIGLLALILAAGWLYYDDQEARRQRKLYDLWRMQTRNKFTNLQDCIVSSNSPGFHMCKEWNEQVEYMMKHGK